MRSSMDALLLSRENGVEDSELSMRDEELRVKCLGFRTLLSLVPE